MEEATLKLIRDINAPDFTLGKLTINDATYFTCERPWKDNAPEISCIPTGAYQVIISYSPHFGRAMPHLLSVPGRDGILIHVANHASELRGCVAIGTMRTKDGVQNSQIAFDDFYPRLQVELAKGTVWIMIT